jgi:chromosome segregation ATPase
MFAKKKFGRAIDALERDVESLKLEVKRLQEFKDQLECWHEKIGFGSRNIALYDHRVQVYEARCEICGKLLHRYKNENELKQAELAYLKKQVAELEEELCEKSQ